MRFINPDRVLVPSPYAHGLIAEGLDSALRDLDRRGEIDFGLDAE